MDLLRVVTLNLWNKSGPWRQRRDEIVRELIELDPDLVGLQELLRLETTGEPWTAANDQLTELVEAVVEAGGPRFQGAFAQAASYGGGLVMGNGLLSKVPLEGAHAVPLPGGDSGEHRVLLGAWALTSVGRWPVFVTHLNWKWHHASVRVRQVRFITEVIDREVPLDDEAQGGAGALPPILMGDFNAEPDSDEIRFLSGKHVIDGKSVHYADAWRWGAGELPGHTFDPVNDFARTSSEPPRRIDYIFTRGPAKGRLGEPVRSRLCFHEPRQPTVRGETAQTAGERLWPSDHFGVVTELRAK